MPEKYYARLSHSHEWKVAKGSRNNSVGTATVCGWVAGVQFPEGEIFLLTPQRVALSITQLFIQWALGALSVVVKRQEREAQHSTLSSA
jgi:hypothetical protein